MSKEALETWNRVVEKGAEKISRVQAAMLKKDEASFKKAHKEYREYLSKVAEITEIDEKELDTCFLDKWKMRKEKEEK